ncbi:hypothetical protein ONE63_007904 [Megalurothrips usitatus]|uniref:Peptidase S1 domain-containing protein n=1 Tax=Megalurothrips usitatus TaxID=439358 RepID=A0AAV7XP49_9NEOP|nr:hypothetical protein ONE63_007904 [Megalurothrips usitatus]
MMPLVPGREEHLQARFEALRSPHPALRMAAPLAGLRRQARPKGAPAAPAAPAATNKAKPTFLFKKADPAVKAQREPQPGPCRQAVHLRIINGQKAVLGQFPWQAGLLADFGEEGKAWCGGSIIHSQWILTAGHCVDDNALGYQVSVGSLGSEQGGEVTRQVFRGLTTFYQHPAYNPYFIDNDIAIIPLPSHIKFSAWCRPVQLPSYSMATDMMAGTTGIVSGWGKTADGDQWITKDLMYTSTTIDGGKSCYDYYGNAWIANKICIKVIDNHAFCSGDSGGAFTFEEEPDLHTQLGIVSFGAAKGCELGLPIVYTRLASFLQFVEDVTNIAIRD